jgi:hypothetical protein
MYVEGFLPTLKLLPQTEEAHLVCKVFKKFKNLPCLLSSNEAKVVLKF